MKVNNKEKFDKQNIFGMGEAAYPSRGMCRVSGKCYI